MDDLFRINLSKEKHQGTVVALKRDGVLIPVEVEQRGIRDGEYFGGFCDSDTLLCLTADLPSVPLDIYRGGWFWEYFVIAPKTHAVRWSGTYLERVRIEKAP